MKFFVDFIPEGESYTLTGENAKHIGISLRARVGESLVLGDMSGNECLCEITGFAENEVLVKIIKRYKSLNEPKIKVTVYQCLPKGDKMETVIQKSVELGVFEIIPVQSENCVVKHDGKTAAKKNERYKKIAEEAAKQCGRGIIPEVKTTISFNEMLKELKGYDKAVFFYEKGGEPLKDILKQDFKTVAFVIGPEGGFSEKEAQSAGEFCKVATLGGRILRTETVAPCVLSAVMYEKDEMK